MEKKKRVRWSREELDATVKMYIYMLKLQQDGGLGSKKKYYEKLSNQFGRTPDAFEFRMHDISSVYASLGRTWLKGLKPTTDPGANMRLIIQEIISEHESDDTDLVKDKSEETVVTKIKKILTESPVGKKSPSKQTQQSLVYDRDPAVIAWLLDNSKGRCENCDQEAPFVKEDGAFYLEVHHVLQLAEDGSDTTTNAVAVCPNCHRELHYGKDREKIRENLYQKIGRLERE